MTGLFEFPSLNSTYPRGWLAVPVVESALMTFIMLCQWSWISFLLSFSCLLFSRATSLLTYLCTTAILWHGMEKTIKKKPASCFSWLDVIQINSLSTRINQSKKKKKKGCYKSTSHLLVFSSRQAKYLIEIQVLFIHFY